MDKIVAKETQGECFTSFYIPRKLPIWVNVVILVAWQPFFQRHLPFRREQRSVSYMMLFVKMRANFLCHFFQWQLCIDAPEFTDCKTLPILLHEIELGKWLRARNIRYFS